MAVSTLLLLLLLPLLHSSAAASVLLTGDTLPCHLAPPNLPLLRHQPNTPLLRTKNCTLTLTRRAQLLIQTPHGSTAAFSPAAADGLYAAILRSDGHVAVYGPSLWSTPRLRLAGSAADAAEPPPAGRGHMFSSQVLNGGSELARGGHALVMKNDCGLELVARASGKVVWESGTKGRGEKCFARLDHRGQVAVVDDRFRVVWASQAGEADGFYVLVVQGDGRAAVYGPAVRSTDS